MIRFAGLRRSLRRPDRRSLGLGAALAASGALLLAPPAAVSTPGPVPAAVAWPHARAASVPATLPDGSAFSPLLFLDAGTAIGASGGSGGSARRLVRRGADGTVRTLRQLPASQYPSFRGVTASGGTVAWVEDTDNGAHLALWAADLDGATPPRHVADVTGDAVLDDGPNDLSIHDGELSWVGAGGDAGEETQVWTARLAGGPVTSRVEPGDWRLAGWPWLVNGTTDPSGTGTLRNLVTHADVAVRRRPGAQTRCSPVWCAVVSLADGGSTDVELMHPDGGARERISTGTAVPAIPDVAVLDRFEVLWRTDANLDLTHNGELLVYDVRTRRTVELSPDAATVTCRGAMLWWSNGAANQAVTSWHTLDLRTVP
ncbi:MAG TPA: hypothetical protein VI248_29450 [Kineosporiaceae bacterium]